MNPEEQPVTSAFETKMDELVTRISLGAMCAGINLVERAERLGHVVNNLISHYYFHPRNVEEMQNDNLVAQTAFEDSRDDLETGIRTAGLATIATVAAVYTVVVK